MLSVPHKYTGEKKKLLGWHVNTCPYGLKKTTLEVLLYRAGKMAELAMCLLCDGRPELRYPAPSWTWLYISVIPSIPTAGWETEARKSLGAHVLAVSGICNGKKQKSLSQISRKRGPRSVVFH